MPHFCPTRRSWPLEADGIDEVLDLLMGDVKATCEAGAKLTKSLLSKCRMLWGSLECRCQTTLVVGVDEGALANLHINPEAFLQPALYRGSAGILLADHGIDADPALRMQGGRKDP
jgi:hypothetical protein